MTLNVPFIDPMTYEEYRALIDRLLAEGKTTGEDQTEARIEYAKLNVQRMNRIGVMLEIAPELSGALHALTRAQTWVVISEGWCGDAAQTVPMIAKAARQSELVSLVILLRDKNPQVMDRFLTNGTRSIPVLVMLDAGTNQVLGVWGPRPAEAKALVDEFKKDPHWNHDQMLTALHTWYAKDKTVSAQKELAALLGQIEAAHH